MAGLYRQLEIYRDSDYYPFHMPGHKRNPEAAEGILAEVYGLDITEIDGFDNLHQAEGILKKEQERAAGIYGAEKTYFKCGCRGTEEGSSDSDGQKLS